MDGWFAGLNSARKATVRRPATAMTFDEKQAKNLLYKKTSEGKALLHLQRGVCNQYFDKPA